MEIRGLPATARAKAGAEVNGRIAHARPQTNRVRALTSSLTEAIRMTAAPLQAHHPWRVAGRMAARGLVLLPLFGATLGAGMAIYHWTEGLPWSDSFLNAAMLLGGMGPVDHLQTTAGKVLAGGYALFAGLVFIVLAGVMLGPVVHAALHRFHLETRNE